MITKEEIAAYIDIGVYFGEWRFLTDDELIELETAAWEYHKWVSSLPEKPSP